MKASYKGEASLNHFASVDKINAEDFLKWDSLHFSEMDIGYAPLSVNISEVALTDFYSRFIINPDGIYECAEYYSDSRGKRQGLRLRQRKRQQPK